jgi:hypothetical protein
MSTKTEVSLTEFEDFIIMYPVVHMTCIGDNYTYTNMRNGKLIASVEKGRYYIYTDEDEHEQGSGLLEPYNFDSL